MGLILNFAERQSVPYEVSRMPIQYRPNCAADFSVHSNTDRFTYTKAQVLWKPHIHQAKAIVLSVLPEGVGVEFTVWVLVPPIAGA